MAVRATFADVLIARAMGFRRLLGDKFADIITMLMLETPPSLTV